MEFETVKQRLQAKARRRAVKLWLGAILGLFAALVILFVTFWVIYAVIWFGFHWFLPHSHGVRIWISLGLVLLLVLCNKWARRDPFEELALDENDLRGAWTMGVGGRASPFGPLIGAVISPRAVMLEARLLTDILYVGPRLLAASVRTMQQARLVTRIDFHGCALVVSVLIANPGRVPYGKIVAELNWLDPVAVFPQVAGIEGVITLKADPPGFTLTPECRRELLTGEN